MAGSLFMLAAIIVFGLQQGTFDLIQSGTSDDAWLFLGFALAFAVKAPLFPLHGWLPDAYRESPPEVAAILSGVVSKAAAYGFLRIAIPKFPGPADDFQVLILVLAATGLVYGSLLAFRAPDLRGVIAYSSLAQMGLITLGLFAFNDLGFDGAVVQMVAHGLVSASLFMLAGAVERRCLTGELSRLGGMARGRPALATLVMTTGIIGLAVPGSVAFAGEFLILAGVFHAGWAWAAIGAGAIVLAAMYQLRLISAILHREPGPAVSPAALDLRPAELAVLVPLVALLLALSAWPAAISEHCLPRRRRRSGRPGAVHAMTPNVDWFAISPSLALLVGGGVALLSAVLVPPWLRAPLAAFAAACGFIGAFVAAALLFWKSPEAQTLVGDAMTRDRFGAMAQLIVAGVGLLTIGVSWSRSSRGSHAAEFYALLAAAGGGNGVPRPGEQPDDTVPRPGVVLGRAVHPLRDRAGRRRLARGRPEVPDHRRLRLGRAPVRVGPRLRGHGRARVRRRSRTRPAPRTSSTTRCWSPGWR